MKSVKLSSLLGALLLLACAAHHAVLALPQGTAPGPAQRQGDTSTKSDSEPPANNHGGHGREKFEVPGDQIPGVTEVIGSIQTTYAGNIPVDPSEPDRSM